MRLPSLAFVVAVAAGSLGADECGGPVLRDPGFDLWCDDQLCAWDQVRGDARRVATWHGSDAGVELVGDDAAIAQRSPLTSTGDVCLEFTLVADVAATAEAYLEVDVFGDGTVERRERMPTARWQPLRYRLAIAGPFAEIEFALTKRGPGVVQLARIQAGRADDCAGLTPIVGEGGGAGDRGDPDR